MTAAPGLRVPIRRIDHVGILTDRPEAVFRFFREDLGLPIAFPFVVYPAYRGLTAVLTPG